MSKIFFTGAGKMATAIAGGLVRSGLYKNSELAAYDVNSAAGEAFTKETGVSIFALEEAVNAEAILIAVKPQMIAQALEPLKGRISDKLIISIAAGVTISQIAELTGAERIVRVMPNTPALVGEGAAAYAPGAGASAEDAALVGRILGAVGVAYQVKESDLDAVVRRANDNHDRGALSQRNKYARQKAQAGHRCPLGADNSSELS